MSDGPKVLIMSAKKTIVGMSELEKMEDNEHINKIQVEIKEKIEQVKSVFKVTNDNDNEGELEDLDNNDVKTGEKYEIFSPIKKTPSPWR